MASTWKEHFAECQGVMSGGKFFGVMQYWHEKSRIGVWNPHKHDYITLAYGPMPDPEAYKERCLDDSNDPPEGHGSTANDILWTIAHHDAQIVDAELQILPADFQREDIAELFRTCWNRGMVHVVNPYLKRERPEVLKGRPEDHGIVTDF